MVGKSDMKTITPWCKDAEKIFDRLSRDQKAFTSDSSLTRLLPRKYPDLFNEQSGFLNIYRNERRRESVILPMPDVMIIPLPEPTSRINEMRRKKYGVIRR